MHAGHNVRKSLALPQIRALLSLPVPGHRGTGQEHWQTIKLCTLLLKEKKTFEKIAALRIELLKHIGVYWTVH